MIHELYGLGPLVRGHVLAAILNDLLLEFCAVFVLVAVKEMDYGFQKRLLEASDLMAANVGDGFSIGFSGKMKRVKRGIRRVRLLLKLQKAASLMKKIDKEYANYPSRPEGLEKWKTTVKDIIDAAVFKK